MSMTTRERNPVLEMMLHVGFGQLKDGLYEDAISTFSAARLMDSTDERPLRGRGMCYLHLKRDVLAEADFLIAESLQGV